MKLLVVIVTLLYVSQHALGVEVEVYNDEKSVVLPCQVTVTDPRFNSVSWIIKRLSDQIVHVRVPRGDILEDQDQDYRGRTSMRTDSLTTGDLSLTLKNPTFTDSETYTCIYREDGLDKSLQEVQLEVTERPPPPPTPPEVIAVAVLVPLLVVQLVAVLGFIGFVKTDEQRVLQVEVEDGEESVQLPFKWTDTCWLRMRMCRICCTCCTRCTCCTCCDLSKVVRVEWVDGDDRKLHVYENGSDQPDQQDQDYRDRTEMKTGDFSLILKEARLKDSRLYYCRVYTLNKVLLRERRVELKVKGQQVLVKSGAESVQLSFQTTAGLPGDIRVEWTDKFYRKVHVYQNGSAEQEQVYRGRTEMNEDLMKTGDYSLKLKHPTVRDSGCYFCSIYSKDGDLLRERTVDLWVPEQHVQVKEGAESVQLSFKTTAGLPEDVRVEWRDKDNRKVHVHQNGSVEQDQVYRGRTEMKKDLMKTGDYSLILKEPMVTDRGEYTCRVYDKDGDLLRERTVELKVKVQQVEVESGAESVLLSFKTTSDLPEDVIVEWMNRDNRKVHVHQNGSVEQEQVYRGRTEMKEDLMKTGDYSLILRHPTVRDKGVYYCRIYNKGRVLLRERAVELWVPGQQVLVKSGAESVQLSFQTTAGLPGDIRVEWMDKDNRKVHVYQNGSVEQDQVYRGRTEMKNDLMKTGDYSLILRHPTVRDRGGYFCRIYKKNGDLLRERRVTLTVTGQHVLEKEGEESVLLPTADLPRGGIDKTFYCRDLQVESGAESVQLSFQTTADLSEDVRVQCTDEGNRKVHVYQNGSVEQDQVYRDRTEMKKEFSLILRHPRETDSGRYTCRVYNKDGDLLSEAGMGLKVKEKNKPSTPGTEATPLTAEHMV